MSSCENNVAIMSGSTTPIIDPIFSEYEYVNVDKIYEPPLENPSPSSHTIDNDETSPEEDFEEIENGKDAAIICEVEAHYINSVPKGEYLQDGQYGDKDSQYGG